MRLAIVTCWLLSAFPALAEPATGQDPLEPARRGQVMCYEPRWTARTCDGITTYESTDPSNVRAIVRSMDRDEPGVILTARIHGRVASGAICYVLDAETFRTATWERDGAPLGSEETTSRLGDMMAQSLDRETCLHPVRLRHGALWRHDTSRDGGALNEGASEYAWVDPADGWQVAHAGFDLRPPDMANSRAEFEAQIEAAERNIAAARVAGLDEHKLSFLLAWLKEARRGMEQPSTD